MDEPLGPHARPLFLLPSPWLTAEYRSPARIPPLHSPIPSHAVGCESTITRKSPAGARPDAQAWAKLHRSFQATEGGEANDAANYLTGGFNTRIAVPQPNSLELGAVWSRIKSCAIKDVFLSTGLRSGLDEEDMEDLGLMTGHAYSVLQCYEVLRPPSYPLLPGLHGPSSAGCHHTLQPQRNEQIREIFQRP